MRRLRTGELIALDAVLATGLALLCVYAALEAPARPALSVREPVWLSWAVGLALGLPIAVRRRWPLAVAWIVLGVSALALLTGIVPDYAVAAPSTVLACALYLVGVAAPRRPSFVVLVTSIFVTAAVVVVASTVLQRGADTTGVAFVCVLAVAAWAIGRAARERRAYAIRSAQQETERALSEERLRIARELHDIVAHSMSLIAVKAAIANHVAEERPQETRDALRIIETTSRGALAEMRQAAGRAAGRGAASRRHPAWPTCPRSPSGPPPPG